MTRVSGISPSRDCFRCRREPGSSVDGISVDGRPRANSCVPRPARVIPSERSESRDLHSRRDTMTGSFYAEYHPPIDLRAAVACTWVARTPSDAATPAAIVPDACSDLVIVGDVAPHVAGPATRTHHVLVPPGTTVVGIRFRPGATRAAFGCDANELRDADPELADVC